jgi:hypothetical protein
MLILLIVSLIVSGLVVRAPDATAQTSETPTSTQVTQPPLPDGAGSILGPRPGQGVAPQQAGDRGGAAQIALFFVIVGAIGGGSLLVRRDIIRTRAKRSASGAT